MTFKDPIRANSTPLSDSFGRRFPYVRLSVTEKCNFRCVYCLPNGYQKPHDLKPELSVPEIRRLIAALGQLGVSKVRITGGEPTLRRDLEQIIEVIAQNESVQKIALSTNGSGFETRAKSYFHSGLRYVNLSLDSLSAETFLAIRGRDRMHSTVRAVDKALEVGFERVKINAVLLKGHYSDQLESFLSFVRDRPVSVRLIELMLNQASQGLYPEEHLSAQVLAKHLVQEGWSPVSRQSDGGPSTEYRHPNYAGRMGFIAPYQNGFCDTCNRIRVTSQGRLKLCLFGTGNLDLRSYLQRDDDREQLCETIRQNLIWKAPSHKLLDQDFGDNRTFSAMGG